MTRAARLAAAVLLAPLAACAALSPQSGAGLTVASVSAVQYDADGRVTQRCEADIRDGKERSDTSLSGEVCGSKFSYEAREVRALRAFEIRAAVERESMQVLGRVVPEVVEAGLSAAASAFAGTALVGAARDALAMRAAQEAAALRMEALRAGAVPR